MKNIIYRLALCSSCLLLPNLHAKEYYGKGYTIISEETGYDDLSISVYKKIYASTVREGLRKLLSGTGWRLAANQAADPEITRLYLQPYPKHKQKLGPMPLDAALSYIAGSAWILVVDPVNKLISFELSAKYSCFPSTKKVCPQ